MPTYTLPADNLIALLETQQGQAELCQQVNSWTKKHTGGVQGLQGYRDNPNVRHHEMFAPLIIGRHDGQYEHITMALLDSGNLLQQPAINAKLHQTLGVGVVKTNVVARGANQLSINIKGISEGIYLKFPNIRTSFLVRPLVVENLASPLNLGSKFNFEFMLTPQLVEQDAKTGAKSNHYELQGQRGKLFPRLVTTVILKSHLQDDNLFLKILEKWPDEGRIGQDTLIESQRKWGNRPKGNPKERDPTITELGEEGPKDIQSSRSQGIKGEDSTHLTPPNIGQPRASEINVSDLSKKEETDVERIKKLARLTSSAQHYYGPEPSEGLEPLPGPITKVVAYQSGLVPLPPEVNQGKPNSVTRDTTDDRSPEEVETILEPKGIPKFSLSAVEGVRKTGLTQMEHYVGRNLEDRGGLPRVTKVAQNYMDSLRDIALDRPPSCQEPDVPGQGTQRRDQTLKHKQRSCEHMRELTYQMFDSPYNTCNTCHHDLPPQATEYVEMDEVPFTAYQDTTVKPGYQDTMMISATLPTEGLVFLEPDREKRPPLLAMPCAISNMTSRYKNAEVKKDRLDSKRRQMRIGQYVVYNTGEDPVLIKKGETMGHCTLIYQDSMDDYLNKMGYMAREAQTDKKEWKRKRTQCQEGEPQEITKTQMLSDAWVEEAFKLSNNKVLKDKPELKGQLIKVLAKHGPAFEGGPYRGQDATQQGAGRTHWITARVELKDDNKGPTHCKQRQMHPNDEDLLSSQLALWIEQGVIEPCESQWNSVLLSVAKKDSTLKRF